MKWFPVLFLVILISCASSQPSSSTPDFNPKDNGFLSQDEVINAFQDKNITGKNFDEKISQKGFLRLRNLIKKTLFFPSKILHKKQKLQLAYSGKGSADLRYRDTYVVSQWNGTCTAHGLVATIENLSNDKVKLSERHTWNKYQEYSCEAAIKAWEGDGCITTNEYWPHENTRPYKGYNDQANCKAKLLKTTYIEDDLQKMINALDNKKPVYVGMSVTRGMLNCNKVISPTSKLTDGGHALSIIGYTLTDKVKGGGYFIVKNSWGSDCGDKGYQYVPFNHCLRNDMYCMFWVVDQVSK